VRALCLIICLGSLEFFLVPLPLFVLVLLVFACLCLSLFVFGFAVVRLVIGRAGFLYFSGVEKLWPTPLYKASMYIVRAFFFTQQFTLLYKNTLVSSRS
jgi:uncharacterized membrane protein